MRTCKHQDDTYYESLINSDQTDIESPSDLNGWNEEEEVLECERDVSEDEDFCAFHRELDIDNREVVRDKLETELKKETDTPFLLTGSSLCRLIFEDITVERPVWILGAKFTNRFELSNVDFEDVVLFQDSKFKDLVVLDSTTFTDFVSFSDTEFHDEFESYVSEFSSKSSFESAEFKEKTIFDRNEYQECSFDYASFKEETRFASCRFRGTASFQNAEFESEAKIATAKEIDEIDVEMNSKTTFDSTVSFKEVMFKQNARINIKIKERGNFQQADLSNCNLSEVKLNRTNLENADLTNCILYNADLRGCKLMGCELNGSRLNRNTKFLGDPDKDAVNGHDHSISSILNKKRCYYDPNADYAQDTEHTKNSTLRNKAMTVYRELQDLGKSTSHSQLQTRSFVRRKDMQKDKYWNDIFSVRSGKTQPIVASARWLRAKFSRVIMLYGESPWRVLFWSLISIVGFALSYITLGLIENGDGVVKVGFSTIVNSPVQFLNTLAGSIYYSALIFTNLSFGRYSPVGLGTYATALETTIGLTMLALFFFVLGRRASK